MIRTILAPVTGNRPDAAGLVTAFLVAKAFQAHVDLLLRHTPSGTAGTHRSRVDPRTPARAGRTLATEEQARAAASRGRYSMRSAR